MLFNPSCTRYGSHSNDWTTSYCIADQRHQAFTMDPNTDPVKLSISHINVLTGHCTCWGSLFFWSPFAVNELWDDSLGGRREQVLTSTAVRQHRPTPTVKKLLCFIFAFGTFLICRMFWVELWTVLHCKSLQLCCGSESRCKQGCVTQHAHSGLFL